MEDDLSTEDGGLNSWKSVKCPFRNCRSTLEEFIQILNILKIQKMTLMEDFPARRYKYSWKSEKSQI